MTAPPATIAAVIMALIIGIFAGGLLAKQAERQREDLEERQLVALEAWARRDCDPEGRRVRQRIQEILEEARR